MPRRRPVRAVGQPSVASWLLTNKVQDETDSEPEATGIAVDVAGGAQDGLILDDVGGSRSPPPPATKLRRSSRVAAAAAAATTLSPLSSPGHPSSQGELSQSLGESEPEGDEGEEWNPTREDMHQNSDGSGEQRIYTVYAAPRNRVLPLYYYFSHSHIYYSLHHNCGMEYKQT